MSETTLLVNSPAMVSKQFFPSEKYTVQLPYNLVVSSWDGGDGAEGSVSEQAHG